MTIDGRNSAGYPAFEKLTSRECEVMEALLKGFTNPQLAKRLLISTNTIKYHLKNIYAKLGVASRDGAIRFYREYLRGLEASSLLGKQEMPRDPQGRGLSPVAGSP